MADITLKLWDLSGNELYTLVGHRGSDFSRDVEKKEWFANNISESVS
ncbi:hypothetical protein NIES4075_66540 [Tolypothrix sp. NIES-4075]|nr:hypothetical protein NIES4075_66540 [Tolypothrix sp. NIES-4075]